MRLSKLFSKSRTISLMIGLLLVAMVIPGAVSAASSSTSAQYIASTIPSTMNTGQSYTVSVTMKNTGTMAWNEASMIRLGAVGDGSGDAYKFGPARIKIPAGTSVLPGAEYTFTFTMTPPATAGYYTPKYRMVWDGQKWFGSRASKSIEVGRGIVSTSGDNALVVSSTIPASMNASQSYPVSITMKNTGGRAWNEVSMIRLGGVGDGTGDARQFGPSRIYLPAGTSVLPGSQYTFTFTMTAPALAGTYDPQYKMVWDGHQWFGSQTTQSVRVISTTGSASDVPDAQFTVNVRQGQSPLLVQFTDQSVSDDAMVYKWDVDNDGKTDYTTKNPSHTYQSPGTYTVKLTVSTPAGTDSKIKTNYIKVTSPAIVIPPASLPIVQFTASPTEGQYPLTVQFDDQTVTTGSSSYQWDVNNDGVVDYTTQNPVHTYLAAGTYTVKLTVRNAYGSSSEIKTGYISATSAPVIAGSGDFGYAANPTGNPIGGGAGYTRILAGTEASVKYVVSTKAELLNALKSAKAGETVFVKGTAVIDMTGTPSVTIPAGVTLASNRGLAGSAGGLLKRTQNLNGGWEEPMFVAGGDYVRVTGLRLQGEMYPQDYGNKGGETYESDYLVGIYAENRKGFEVDNCELYGWAWSCVSLRQNSLAPIPYIHHNYIHHNQARGEGYGVNLYGGNALIEANLFDYNRHDVTGAGMAGEQYEVRYNHVIGHGTAIGASHFDVHQDEETGTGAAGAKYLIHHNTVDTGTVATVHIRARPTIGVFVDHNIINARDIENGVPGGLPIYQTNSNQNMFVTNNYWMGKLYPGNNGIVWYE